MKPNCESTCQIFVILSKISTEVVNQVLGALLISTHKNMSLNLLPLNPIFKIFGAKNETFASTAICLLNLRFKLKTTTTTTYHTISSNKLWCFAFWMGPHLILPSFSQVLNYLLNNCVQSIAYLFVKKCNSIVQWYYLVLCNNNNMKC